jgi:beta-galactosidase
VSAYELYYAAFGASADKVFASQEQHPYVAGEFVWTGWDYLGEPTPFYSSRSSYSGIIDLAGFKKDRFYLYQAHWRPDFPMAHILPHWTWPERDGQVTLVHVFTSGDEAELFINGKSLGRKTKGRYEYRLRWEMSYIGVTRSWPAGRARAGHGRDEDRRPCRQLRRRRIEHDCRDGRSPSSRSRLQTDATSYRAKSRIRFSLDGPGEIVAPTTATDELRVFPIEERNAFNGLCLAMVRAQPGQTGTITVKAESAGLPGVTVAVRSEAAR